MALPTCIIRTEGNTFRFISLCLLVTYLFAGCSPTRYLKENELLLNRYLIKGVNTTIHPELSELMTQKPNKKILGLFRFHLGVYNMASIGRERKFKWWIKNNIGEAPVLYDSLLTEKNINQMKLYLFNKGFFDARVHATTSVKKKKLTVYYDVITENPYTINNIYYEIADNPIKNYVLSDSVNSMLKRNKQFDVSVLDMERKRLTNGIKNQGYYFFSKELIFYEIDSSISTHSVDLTLGINTSEETKTHQTYYINDVYINTDYNPQQNLMEYDVPKDTLVHNNYHFIYIPKKKNKKQALADRSDSSYFKLLRYKPDAITASVDLIKGDYFQQYKVEKTYSLLNDLGMFRFINILLAENKHDSLSRVLNCNIQLTSAKKQALILETEGTTSSGNPGIAANLIYKNRNILKGAELFEFRINGGLEAQADSNTFQLDSTITTREFGVHFNITFPKYLVPFAMKDRPKDFNPKTRISTSYNMEKRINYFLRVLNSSLSYNWKEFDQKVHTIYPFEVNFVKSKLLQDFEQRLIQTNNHFLLRSFDQHLTTLSKYTFVYNNQVLNTLKQKNFIYFKGSFELAGNSLSLANKILNFAKSDSTGSYQILGLRFSQFIKPDIDFRYYYLINSVSSIVSRVLAGIAIPYGNSKILPFEKQYFIGGTNSLRAWRVREVGPGSYYNPSHIDQTGEIKIETNIEYRFDIFNWLEGAFFIDAGNIWTIQNDTTRPGTQFKYNTFLGDMAIGAGAGIRWDFTFVVIRLDAAFPLKNPGLLPGKEWVINDLEPLSQSWRQNNIIYNLGIGYPF